MVRVDALLKHMKGRSHRRNWSGLTQRLLALRHLSLSPHHPVGSVANRVDALSPSSHYRLRSTDAVADVLAAHDIPLVVSGHIHWPAVVDTGDAHQIIAPAACSFPQAALLVHVEPRGTTISLLLLVGQEDLREAYQRARQSERPAYGVRQRGHRRLLSTLSIGR